MENILILEIIWKKICFRWKKIDETDALTKHIKDYGSMLVFFEAWIILLSAPAENKKTQI